jgi:hypothetical protein
MRQLILIAVALSLSTISAAHAQQAQTQGTTITRGSVACVDEKGNWRNWPWANAPTLSPRCADVAPEPVVQKPAGKAVR